MGFKTIFQQIYLAVKFEYLYHDGIFCLPLIPLSQPQYLCYYKFSTSGHTDKEKRNSIERVIPWKGMA